MHAVILAGGKGVRLRPYTTALPKPLVPIGDQHAIRELAVDGHLIETGSDDAPANELRPVQSGIDGSGALDRVRQHSY